MDNAEIEKIMTDVKKEVMVEFNSAEHQPKPSIDKMFSDVYDQETPALLAQKSDLHRLLQEYPNDFSELKDYQSS